MCFRHAWGAWSTCLELPASHMYNFLHRLMLLILFSYDLCQGDSSLYSLVIFIPDLFLGLHGIIFISHRNEVSIYYTVTANLWAGFRETPKNWQAKKHGKLFSSYFHQMLPEIFQSITGYYKDIRASPFQVESTLISSVPKQPSCWLYLSASPEPTALSFAAVSLPWLCFTHRK